MAGSTMSRVQDICFTQNLTGCSCFLEDEEKKSYLETFLYFFLKIV